MAKIELIDVCTRFTTKHKETKNSFISLPSVKSGEHKKVTPFSIDNVNLEIPDAKTLVILGPSGCGKTTLLKIIAGLIPVESGNIRFDGVDVMNLKPGERKIGMVFQDYALYPHLTSKQNILAYFLFRKRTREMYAEAKEKFDKTSELMGVDLEYLLDRKPGNLSGGEKQRVAVGRCITRDPKVFLMDEPFSNLDRMLRDKYRKNLKTLLRKFNVTTVYVTHDQLEAYFFADIIAIMNDGCIEQTGTYEEVYNQPASIFVSDFLNINTGCPAINIIDGSYVSGEFAEVLIGVRSEDIIISNVSKDNYIRCEINDRDDNVLQKTSCVIAALKDTTLSIQTPLREDLSPGKPVWLSFQRFHTFDKNTKKRIKTYTI